MYVRRPRRIGNFVQLSPLRSFSLEVQSCLRQDFYKTVAAIQIFLTPLLERNFVGFFGCSSSAGAQQHSRNSAAHKTEWPKNTEGLLSCLAKQTGWIATHHPSTAATKSEKSPPNSISPNCVPDIPCTWTNHSVREQVDRRSYRSTSLRPCCHHHNI